MTGHTRDIRNVSDLGNDWTLIGVDSGDTSHVKIDKRHQQYVAVISVKFGDDEGGQRVLYFLGYKKFLASEQGRLLVANITQKYNLRRQVQPVENPSVLKTIYNEWDVLVKANKVHVNDEKKKDTVAELGNVKEATELIEQCLNDGVSDVHLEVRDADAKIRRRINGVISDHLPLSAHQGKSWGNTIYNVLVTVGSEIFDPNIVQDGLIDKDLGSVRLRGRVATSPVQPNGFDMVIRLLKIQSATKPQSMETLGYSHNEIKRIEIATNKPSGVIIVAGTTGSGKSTTLQNLLMTKILQEKAQIKVITVEDPVEYFIPNATQISVVRDKEGNAEKSFGAAMRAAMRQDPDILMVGEIRDNQSCALMRAAAQSGHPVYSTVHASSCIAIISRLEALGLGRDVMASQNFIAGFFYQKLLAKVCPHCAQPLSGSKIPFRLTEKDFLTSLKILSQDSADLWYGRYCESSSKVSFVRYLQDKRVINCEQADNVASSYIIFNNREKAEQLYDRIKKMSDIKNDKILFRGKGCKLCKHSGIIGRVPVSEGITFDGEMLEMVARNDEQALTSYWRKNKGGRFALEDAIVKMRHGLVDPVDIESHLDLLDSVSI
ncbi:ATPase, T2SS/T4P/T4SS family [Vibrio coralliirubri]|uniref:GspE/PulE family protein n=1 Tax=Vibrio coralliirubri TaxID=1516159 RepID=UPI0022847446|nr:ATPase, T2SS/T4P/T4SS family [Vibrio coralliirubri]MCY9866113.1 ATPase, T2SS/T4P/T4SS family [Vibrio coralliirubri]